MNRVENHVPSVPRACSGMLIYCRELIVDKQLASDRAVSREILMDGRNDAIRRRVSQSVDVRIDHQPR